MKPEPSEVKADQSLKTISTLHHNDLVTNGEIYWKRYNKVNIFRAVTISIIANIFLDKIASNFQK